MKINVTKTKVRKINFSGTPLSLIPDFGNVAVTRILGVYFNVKLSWSDHFDFIVKSVPNVYAFRILKNCCLMIS